MKRIILGLLMFCVQFLSQSTNGQTAGSSWDTNIAAEYLNTANAYYKQGNIKKANEFYDKVINILNEAVNIQISKLGESNPDVASSYSNIAAVYLKKSEFNKALEYMMKAMYIQINTLGETHSDLAYTFADIGHLNNRLGNSAEALKYYKKAIDVIRFNNHGDNRKQGVILNNIASIYYNLGRYDEALEYYLKTLRLQKDSLSGNHPDIAITLSNIGNTYLNKGEYPNAIAYLEESLHIQQKNSGVDHIDLVPTYHNLGLLSFKLRDYDKAVGYLLESLNILKNYNKLEDSLLSSVYNIIGRSYYEMGNIVKALEYYTKIAGEHTAVMGMNPKEKSVLFGQLGVIYYQMGEPDSALYYLSQATDFRLKNKENLPLNIISDLNIISNIYFDKGENGKALKYLLIIPDLVEKNSNAAGLEDLTTVYNNIGLNYAALGNHNLALEYFFKAYDYYTSRGGKDEKIIVPININIAGIYAEKGDYGKALENYEKILNLKQKKLGAKHPELAVYYNNIGFLYKELKEYEKALDCYEKALKCEFQSNRPKSEYLAMNYYNISTIYMDKEDYETALKYLDMAMEIELKRDRPDDEVVSMIFSNIGLIYNKSGKYEDTREYLEKAIRKHQDKGGDQSPKVASLYSNLGDIYNLRGEYSSALEYYELALNIMLNANPPQYDDIAATYNRIGAIYVNRGDYGKALENYQNALNISLEYSNHNDLEIATIYNNIGIIYNNRHEYDKALEYYRKALEIQLKFDDAPFTTLAKSYNNISGIFINKNEYEVALDYMKKALDIQEKILGGDHPDIAYTYSRFGNIYFKMNQYDRAIEYLSRALQIRRKFYGTKHPLVAFSYNNLGLIYFEKGQYDKALDLYQQAIIANIPDYNDTIVSHNPGLNNALSKPYLFESLRKKANTFYFSYIASPRSTDDLKKALATYDLALALLDIIRNEYKVEDSRLFLSEQTKSTFSDAISVALELNYLEPDQYLEKAFEIMEKSKSATLLAQLYESNAKRFSGIPDSLLQLEKQLRTDILFYQTLIQNERGGMMNYDVIKVGALTNKYARLLHEYDSLINNFEKNYPRYYNLKYQDKIASIKEIQSSLDQQTAILEYFVGTNRLYIFIITSASCRVANVPIENSFEQLVANYYRSLKKIETRDYADLSGGLYNFLIRPVTEFISGKEKLIIIPDDYLFYVPFETIASDDFSGEYESDFSKYDFLIQHHEISYHYSANIWHNSKNEPKPVSRLQESFVGFAPIFRERNDGSYTWAERPAAAANIDMSAFPDIVYAQEEVRSIDRLFQKKNYTSSAFYQMEASEARFKSVCKGYKYVHIATHAFSNDNQPDLSGMIFSLQPPVDTIVDENFQRRKEDDILYSGEMYNLDLNADLVVLSACEGGVGKLVRGEGLIAMTRGFLYSGTPNIVFSLWRVSDIHTKDLMLSFYKGILNSENYSKALRNAKLEMIRDRKTAFPKYWGGFVLIGI